MAERHILLVDSDATRLAALREALVGAEISGQILQTTSLAGARQTISSGGIHICFIGAGIELATQQRFVTSVYDHWHEGSCAMIVVTELTDRNHLLELAELGVHGVLLLPVEETSLRQVVVNALHAYEEQLSKKPKAQEQVVSLPWVIESIADRLDAIARKEREVRPAQMTRDAVSIREIQEALISAFTPPGHGSSEE